MGTSAPPARGYADDQRVDNYDSPDLFVEFDPLGSTTHQTPWMDVSRYAYLAGTDQLGNDAGLVHFAWSSVNAAEGAPPSRSFTLSQLINAFAQYRIENLGPWLQITWTQPGGGAASHSARLFGTNRVHPLEFIPANPLLTVQEGNVIAGGATATVYPLDYYAGPVQVRYLANAASTLILQQLGSDGNWHTIAGVTAPAVNVEGIYKLVTPPGAWRFQVINTSGAAESYWLVTTPSLTGST